MLTVVSDVLKLLAATSAKSFASISKNSVGNDGAVALAQAFTEQRTLLTLRSVWMRRSAQTVTAPPGLGYHLAHVVPLPCLYPCVYCRMTDCYVGNEGGIALARFLGTNPPLHTLMSVSGQGGRHRTPCRCAVPVLA